MDTWHLTDDERRDSKRITYRESVKFQFKNPQDFGGCLSADISGHGMRLNLNDFIACNEELLLEVKLATEKIVQCMGRVVWVEKQRFSDRYQAGIEFVDSQALSEVEKDINKLIIEKAENKSG